MSSALRMSIESLRRRAHRRIVACCCVFHDEFRILNWRLHELSKVVDIFIVVESTMTFSGRAKPLHLLRNQRWFSGFSDRLLHVGIQDSPIADCYWLREFHQRTACFTRGVVKLNLPLDALVIISDVDEVIDPKTVDALAWSTFEDPICVASHWYNFNWSNYLGPFRPSIGVYTVGFLQRLCAEGNAGLIGARCIPAVTLSGEHGWHASYFSRPQAIAEKLLAYSHADDPATRELLRGGSDYFRMLTQKAVKDLYGNFPVLCQTPTLPRFAHLALPDEG